MIGFGLEAAYLADLALVAGVVGDEYVERVKGSGEVPKDTSKLEDGIEVVSRETRGSVVTIVVASTARSDDGADYGTILDTSKGQKIKPRPGPDGKKALANVRTGWGPYASARLTTKHVGWWEKSNSQQVWRAALDVLSRFNL